ncbi:MAG: LLM class flavin-dependent oxidoreductase [Gammaproteobacteria bacterium]|nr:LLM class flavin-dependent oxidoreductase [Gammaproteobacteria bacterium]
MELSIGVGAVGDADIEQTVQFVQFAESLGVQYVWSAEAWGADAVTSIAYLAGRTQKIRLGTGIMQISARAPAMTAMTALSLAKLSNDRFLLGLGVSGPQVVEGLHGVPYAAPLTRLRETVDIVRLAASGEKIRYAGKHHQLPLPQGEGKAIRLSHPPRNIPIFLATISPRSLAYTGAAADGWLGTSFSPNHAEAHLAHLRRGAEQAGRDLTDIALHVSCTIGIGDDVERMVDAKKAGVAFNMGAMGSANTNFYNEAFQRAGFVDDALAIQRLWLDGRREQAAARVPDEMVTEFGAIGTPAMVSERLKLYEATGINCLNLRLDLVEPKARYALLEQAVDLANGL